MQPPVSTSPTLLTGASGYLGAISGAALLEAGAERVIGLLRDLSKAEAVRERILGYLPESLRRDERVTGRLSFIAGPNDDSLPDLAGKLRDLGVRRIAHCAGCVDYFNLALLEEGNIRLTERLLELGRRLDVERFVFLSTAFSGGFREGVIPETLHEEPPLGDPTEYTKSKRRAEHVVAGGGLPWIIMRPGVVVGDSRDGRYEGKNYGMYQLWAAAERFFCSEYHPIVHTIANSGRPQLIHQDSYQNTFRWGWGLLEPGAILHMVSRLDSSPNMQMFWKLWADRVQRPRELFIHNSATTVDLRSMTRRGQMWIEFCSVNIEIGGREWMFDMGGVEQLRQLGMPFVDSSPETIAICQERFIQNSDRIRKYMEKYAEERKVTPRIHLVEPGGKMIPF
jgi:nucleoside-diphosphate-sugar epimerase